MLYFDLCIIMVPHNISKNSQDVYSESKCGIQIDCFSPQNLHYYHYLLLSEVGAADTVECLVHGSFQIGVSSLF